MEADNRHREQPLVSLIIITYNSSAYIIDTLDSARDQTYKNIELIITDDGSTDQTADLCREWIAENNTRFARAELITSRVNTGIPANMNRALERARGEWVKGLAGDDIFTRDCIATFMEYIAAQKEEISILYSNYIRFFGNALNSGEVAVNNFTRFYAEGITAREQYELLLRENQVFGSTVMIKRELLVKTNGFDERFRLLEDWPLWVRITGMGYKMHYLDKPLIYYRIHGTNLSQTTLENYIFHPVEKLSIGFRREVIASRLPFLEGVGLRIHLISMQICFLLGNNRKNPLTHALYIFFKVINPYIIYRRLFKHGQDR